MRHLVHLNPPQGTGVRIRLERFSPLYKDREAFPVEFLRLLGKQAIAEIRLGDQIQQEMTVMFADIRGFTARSEDMTPAECFGFVNRVFSALCPVVRGYHGYIDKFLGDGFLALFPRAATDAVEAAVAIQRRLAELNARSEGPAVRLAIGLHSGVVMLGTVVAFRRGALVSVDLMLRLSSGVWRSTVRWIITSTALAYLAVLVWFGVGLVTRVRFQTFASMELSMGWAYAALPVGAALAMVSAMLIGLAVGRVTARERAAEARP